MSVIESPHQPLTPDEEALVRSLGRVMHALPRAIDADMVRAWQMSLTDYTALMYLSEAPHRRMRMSELAAACDFSLSGMTRVVVRLEGQGLIQRATCEDDARVSNAILTEAGLVRLEQAWPTNLASVRRYFLNHLEGFDLARLAQAFQHFGTD